MINKLDYSIVYEITVANMCITMIIVENIYSVERNSSNGTLIIFDRNIAM